VVSEKSLDPEAFSGFPVPERDRSRSVQSRPESLAMERREKAAPTGAIGGILALAGKGKWKSSFTSIPFSSQAISHRVSRIEGTG